MAAKARTKKTPAMMLWGMVAAEKQAQNLSNRELADLAGCSDGTVSLDANCPERIPLSRLFCYFAALGIDAATVIRPIAQAYIDNLVAR